MIWVGNVGISTEGVKRSPVAIFELKTAVGLQQVEPVYQSTAPCSSTGSANHSWQ